MSLDAIFKAYDVRGLYPDEIDEALARRIGNAFAHFTGAQQLIVGHDMRPSSVPLATAFIEGATLAGADVTDIGLCSTDVVYFAAGKLDAPGAMFTASHNPAEYNGIKLCRAGAAPVGEQTGLTQIKEMVAAGVTSRGEVAGKVEKLDLLEAFGDHVRSFVDTSVLRPLSVVADTANGMGGLVVPKVFEGLPFSLTVLFGELDGSFPNHPADPIQLENLKDLQRAVLDLGADVGLAFDGDADRVFLVDDAGQPVSGSTTTAIVAAGILDRHPGETIVHNLICSRTPEVIREHGGIPVRTRVGHSFIKQVMAETGAIFGGEHSAHYYFRDNWRADSGSIAALFVLEQLSRAGVPLSELRKPFERYVQSGEINSRVDDTSAVIERVATEFASANQDRVDGLTVDAGDWWFNLRPSNTEPLLRLNLEAPDAESCDAHTAEVLALIRSGRDDSVDWHAGAADATRRLKYRPHLDGLRAVAVYLVVAFHAGFERARGGFVGVDVFFVLSGYLVTRILLEDLTATGRIAARRFYARRARRVLPAALVTLVITALAYAIVATPAERFLIVDGVRAAFVYVANWLFVHQSTDYFAPTVTSSPVLHFWSLAVEEQFYLLWPLLLGGLWLATRRVGPRQATALHAVIVVAAVASAIAALRIGATDFERAYYGTDTRAYQLLAGAALALTPQLFVSRRLAGRVAHVGSALALLALVVLASSAFTMSPISRGVYVAVAAAALIVTLEQAHDGLVARALSAGPVAYLGRISYGVYLWHWPVIVIALHNRHLSATQLFVISVVVSTALAAVSYRVLEHPIRASRRALDRYRVPVIAAGLAASLVCGLIVAPAILEPDNTSVSASGVNGPSAAGLRLLDWRVALDDIPPLPNCTGRAVFRCTLEHGSGARVLLIGDSVARAWIPTFRGVAKKRQWKFSVATRPVCPWQRDLQNFLTPAQRAVCRGHQEDWYERVIPKLDPDIIILAHQAYDDPVFPVSFFDRDGKGVLAGSPRLESVLDDASDASLKVLRESGRQVVIIEPLPVPKPPFDPLNCLSKGGATSQCRYEANRRPSPLEEYYRSYADAHRAVVAVDADRFVCPDWPTCDPVVGSIIVKRDPTHLTATFARSLADPMDALLRRSGVAR